MQLTTALLPLLFVSSVLCREEEGENDVKEDVEVIGWAAKIGDVCEYNNETFPLPSADASKFIECIQPFRDPDIWPWHDKGTWKLKECRQGFRFVPVLKTCKSMRFIRRTQARCNSGGNMLGGICPSRQVRVRYIIRRQQPSAVNCPCQPPAQGNNCLCQQPQIQQPIAQPVYPQPQPVQPVYPQPVVQPQPVYPVQPVQTGCSNGCAPQPTGGCPTSCPRPAPQPVIQPQPIQTGCSNGCAPQPTGGCPTSCPRPAPQPVIQPQPVQSCPCQQPQLPSCPQTCQQPAPQPVIQPQPQPSCNCQQPRPQPSCGCQQQPIVQPQPCPNAPQGYQGARPGGRCSWMLAPLAPAQSRNSYLQCQPAPAPENPYCGTWCTRPCAPGTIFDVQVQVCVHDPNARPAPQQQSCGCQGGGIAIGSCNSFGGCPGQSQCQTAAPAPQPIVQPAPQPSCNTCCMNNPMSQYGKKK